MASSYRQEQRERPVVPPRTYLSPSSRSLDSRRASRRVRLSSAVAGASGASAYANTTYNQREGTNGGTGGWNGSGGRSPTSIRGPPPAKGGGGEGGGANTREYARRVSTSKEEGQAVSLM